MEELIEGVKYATEDVTDAEIDISIRQRVGDEMGEIKNATRVFSNN